MHHAKAAVRSDFKHTAEQIRTIAIGRAVEISFAVQDQWRDRGTGIAASENMKLRFRTVRRQLIDSAAMILLSGFHRGAIDIAAVVEQRCTLRNASIGAAPKGIKRGKPPAGDCVCPAGEKTDTTDTGREPGSQRVHAVFPTVARSRFASSHRKDRAASQ